MFYGYYTCVVLFCIWNIIVSCLTAENEGFLKNPYYTSNSGLKNFFDFLQNLYPNLAKTHTIGKSVQGSDIYAFEISKDFKKRSLLKPMFKFVANIHGDEAVGRQLIVFFAQYLLSNYKNSDRVKRLADSVDIYLLPSLNPDGFASSVEGVCESDPSHKGRNNRKGIDLDEDFPDVFDTKYNAPSQPETIAMTDFMSDKHFVLSGNFQGGAVVASYPYDNSHAEGKESKTPDDAFFKALASTYASRNPSMRSGTACNGNFANGITNGAIWRRHARGMQDYNYAYADCFEVTLHVSCCSYPKREELPGVWQENQESMLAFAEAAVGGVKGLVKDAEEDRGIGNAVVEVEGIDKEVKTNADGEGTYRIRVRENDLFFINSDWKTVKVVAGKAVRLDFEFKRKPNVAFRPVFSPLTMILCLAFLSACNLLFGLVYLSLTSFVLSLIGHQYPFG